jgi:hypothetical protein
MAMTGPPQQPYGGYQQPAMQQQPVPQAPPRPEGDPRLSEALGTVDLLPGEQPYFSLQADGFFVGVNPFAKMFASIMAFFVTITGGHIRIFMVVTNQRLLILQSTAQWCGLNAMKVVKSFALASVKEVASVKATAMCCIHTRLVQVHSVTERHNLVIKKLGDQQIRQFVTQLSGVIVANSVRAGM